MAVAIFTLLAILSINQPAMAEGGAGTSSTVNVTELRISFVGGDELVFRPAGIPNQQTNKGQRLHGDGYSPIDSTDINRLRSVDFYMDTYNRITAVKISRESYTGDIVTSLLTGVREFSVQTVKPGSRRPSSSITISVKSAASLRFP
jgi:hypothetical protein